MVRIECSCGKKASVKDELAGKKVRCPACKEAILVPGGSDDDDDEDAKPAREEPKKKPALNPAAAKLAAKLGNMKRKKADDDDGDDADAGEKSSGRPPCEKHGKPIVGSCERCGDFVCRKCLGGDGKLCTKCAPDAPKRLLKAEAHVRAISVWNRVSGILVVLIGLALFVMGGAIGARLGGAAGGVIAIMALFFIAYGIAVYVVGHFLWQYQNWARWTTVVFNGLGILLNLYGAVGAASRGQTSGGCGPIVGTVYAVFVIVQLCSESTNRICMPEYREAVARDRSARIEWWKSPFFYAPAILVALGLAIICLAFGALAAR